MDFPCVLCGREIVKYQERYLVEGRGTCNVREELKSLPFNVNNSSRFICQQCLRKLKKRKGLICQLREIDSALESA